MIRIKEIIVVEGKSDVDAVRRAVDAECIITSGFGITGETFRRIAAAQQRKGVVILTDPDHAGEQIRRRIQARVPGCKNAHLIRNEATRKGDIGVENADAESIRRALASARCLVEAPVSVFDERDLQTNNLMGGKDSARRREALGRKIGIGQANAKQWLRRLNRYGITRCQFRDALSEIENS